MISTASAVACGIALDPILLSGSDLLTSVASNDAGGSVNSVTWSPDAQYVAIGDVDDLVRVLSFDETTLSLIVTSTFTLGGNVNSVDWSPDGQHIASGDSGDNVRVFSFDGSSLDNVATSTFTLGGDVRSVAWSPDGKFIASGDNNNNVRVFRFDATRYKQCDKK